ncbi:hypothetical protein [Mycolicibacterium thermoresistibile]|nr:hypothetical protein [Mycolicibacterium thermoresistibile]MCV7189388.1 hypothetical protein [Mycolicibacterium thermoresistibile]GAT15052.1 putative uncharacterized protein [Mycolicibacterium thermoresistibile]SNW16398.1 Conserved membrane protein of uncharacterised function [Mycolicibacterium thermoresistibile]
MSDEATAEPAPEQPEDDREEDRVLSGFGIASTLLALIAVGAVVLGVMIWSGHTTEADERRHQTEALAAAADWTTVLVNMNTDNVETSLRQLQEGTVGALNADFEAAMQPYTQLVQKLRSRTRGQVESVAIESVHRQLPPLPGAPPPRQREPQPELEEAASRTDTVIVVATSMTENVGDTPPQTVRWNLRLDVTDVDGRKLISRLETIR